MFPCFKPYARPLDASEAAGDRQETGMLSLTWIFLHVTPVTYPPLLLGEPL
jgi:hypothetical protein